jgi:POT family proton-dependent oligopeptide transporter
MPEVVEIGDRLSVDIRPTQQPPCINEKSSDAGSLHGTRIGDEDLTRVADNIPIAVWLVILISTLERFAFFGIREPFRESILHLCRADLHVLSLMLHAENYLQNERDDPLRPGALGLGQSKATSLSYMFSFLLYTMPLLASVIIDCFLGRYRGILVFLG